MDPLLEHRVRLAICAMLARRDEINFSAFKDALQQTDGNLGAQLRKLEDNGYIELRRTFAKRRPVTWYSLTVTGRSALDRHIAALNQLVGNT